MNPRSRMLRWLVTAVPFAAALFALIVIGGRQAFADDAFLRGDVNSDGQISISDTLMLRRFLFNGDRAPSCYDAADANDDGVLDLSDAIKIIGFAFLGGAPPAAPYPAVGPDPTSDENGSCDYTVVPPVETEDLLRIGDVTGSPGQMVRIPVIISNSVDLEAFQVIVAYDPQVLVVGHEETFQLFQGSYYEAHYEAQARLGGYGLWITIRPNPDEGIIACGFIPHLFEEGHELPPGNDQVVFFIGGKISQSAAEGTVVHLDPVNTGYGPATIRNEVTHRGEGRFVSLVPKTVGGILHIVPDQTPFVRGDSNNDARVDISDAKFTLNFLYLGESAPACLDAADANDDNRIDISDAIFTLQFLFLGGSDPPQPYPLSGLDPTPDGLKC